VANPITVEQLIHRIIRQFYISLLESGVAGIVPDIVKSARLAYVRTLGEIKSEDSEKLKEILSAKAGVKVTRDNIEASLAMEATKEIEIFKKLITVLPKASLEESEDELLRLLHQLDGNNTQITNMATRISFMSKMMTKLMSKDSDSMPNMKISVVFVFDELDKLLVGHDAVFLDNDMENRARDYWSNKDNQNDIDLSLRYNINNIDENFAQRYAKTVADVIYGMKQILSTSKATFIFISDERTAMAWQKESNMRLDRESLLQTVFSEHIHLEPLKLEDIKNITSYYTKNENSRLNKTIKNLEEILDTSDSKNKKNILTVDDFNKNIISYYIFYESLGIPKNIILTLRSLIKLNEINTNYFENNFMDKFHEKSLLGFYIYTLCNNQEILKILKDNEIYETQFIKFIIFNLDYMRNEENIVKLQGDDRLEAINDLFRKFLVDEFIDAISLSLITEKISFCLQNIINLKSGEY